MTEQRMRFPGAAWLLLAVLACQSGQPRAKSGEPRAESSSGSPLSALGSPLSLADLIRLALEQNPSLRQAGWDIEAAQGRAVQVGLYPNPTVTVILDELGDRTGPGGVNTLPQVTQEIVTGAKRHLSRSVAQREVDQASLALMRQRYVLFTTVRQGYFDVLAVRRRIEVLNELVKLATQSYETAQELRHKNFIADIDLLPIEVELNRLQADRDASLQEHAAAWGRLAASMGVPNLPPVPLLGSLDADLPAYDFEPARAGMLEVHPEVRLAQVGVTRAQLALRRAQAEPIPNITVAAGYVRQNQNKSDDWMFQVGVPVPLFDRNQGNIRAAQAELGRAVEEVIRVQNDLTSRLWTAFGQYAAARQRAERYRTAIVPGATRAHRLAAEAFRGGQFEYLRVLQAQRAVAETNLEYIRTLGDAWRAASAMAGLLLEEHWPLSIE